MRLLRLLCLPIIFAAIAITLLAQAPPSSSPQTQQPAPEAPKQIPSLDLTALDKSADACVDFYQYACGNWIRKNPIPADQPSWGRFNELHERNQTVLRGILEKAAANNAGRDAVHQKIGDYYASCMDEAAINKLGSSPLRPELARIAALKSKADLASELAHLHSIGVRSFFRFSSDQDFKDASQVIAEVDQGGLGLPDRDYYSKEDPKSVATRTAYVQHVANMFKLVGEPAQQAAADAKTVLDVETQLAKASMTRVARREPSNIYHKMTKAQFLALSPDFEWNRYLTGVQAPAVQSVNVAVPDFVKELNTIVSGTDLNAIKTYLRWNVIHTSAAILSSDFVNENFNFYGKTLQGTKELRPRWKRCVQY